MKWVGKQFIGIPGQPKELFVSETFDTKKEAEIWVEFMDSGLKARGHDPALFEFKIEEKPD